MEMHVLADWVGLMMVNDVHDGRGYNARAGITDRCVWNPEVCVYLFFFLFLWHLLCTYSGCLGVSKFSFYVTYSS